MPMVAFVTYSTKQHTEYGMLFKIFKGAVPCLAQTFRAAGTKLRPYTFYENGIDHLNLDQLENYKFKLVNVAVLIHISGGKVTLCELSADFLVNQGVLLRLSAVRGENSNRRRSDHRTAQEPDGRNSSASDCVKSNVPVPHC